MHIYTCVCVYIYTVHIYLDDHILWFIWIYIYAYISQIYIRLEFPVDCKATCGYCSRVLGHNSRTTPAGPTLAQHPQVASQSTGRHQWFFAILTFLKFFRLFLCFSPILFIEMLFSRLLPGVSPRLNQCKTPRKYPAGTAHAGSMHLGASIRSRFEKLDFVGSKDARSWPMHKPGNTE